MVTPRVRADAQEVVLEVEDNGPGLPSARLEALRTGAVPVRMAPQAGSGQVGGLGLGLAIVAEITALFGADCRFATLPGGQVLTVSCRVRAAL